MRAFSLLSAAFVAINLPLFLACEGTVTDLADDGGGDDDDDVVDVVFPPSDMGCDSLTLVTASHWSSSAYYPSTPHQECRCRYTYGDTVSVSKIGTVVNITAAARSKQTHADVPWGSSGNATPNSSNVAHFTSLGTTSTTSTSGDYDVYFSLYRFDGTQVDSCDDYAPVRWDMDADPAPAPPPPARRSARGTEDDLQCARGVASHAQFGLAYRPGAPYLELLATGGEPRYAGTWVDEVLVTSFGSARGVIVEVPGQEPITLSPDAPFAELPPGLVSFADLRTQVLTGQRGAPAAYPQLDLGLSCPDAPPPPPVPEEVGYRLSPVDFGLPGVAKYILRLVPDHGQDPDLKHLVVEIQGRSGRTGVPATRIDDTHWQVDARIGLLDLAGTVEVLPQEMVLRVDQGTISGIDVAGQELRVPVYP